MNGIQIEHLLNIVDDKSASNRSLIRREAAEYLKQNMESIVRRLSDTGEALIPTSNGAIRLTVADLEQAAA